jgi:hypothetical protein
MRPNLLAGSLFVAVLLLLVIPSSTAAQADAKLYELRGKVVSATTAEPVPGALLQIPGQPACFSDSDGTFVFSDLPPGRVNISVRKPGFFTEQQLGGMAFDPSVEVPSNGPVLLKVTPEAIFFGEVKNADGEPIEGISVRAERWRLIEGRRQLSVEKQATTDDQGKFRIAELVPGKYYLAFLPGGNTTMFVDRISRKTKPQEGYGLQFYPGVADVQAATAFAVRAGANVHVTHSFKKQQLFQVSGTVRGNPPHRAFDMNLSNSSGEQVPANPRIDRSTGDFQIPGLPAGTYLLTAVQFAVQPSAGVVTGPPMTATQSVFVDRDLSEVVLTLGSGISIPVQLHEEFSLNAGETHQVFVHAEGTDFVQNSAAVTVPPPPEDRRSANTLENLSPGTFWVEAQPNSPQDYVAELRCGNLNLLRDQLVIAPGASLPPIDVTLRNDSAQLTVALNQKDRPAAIFIYSSDYPHSSRMPFPAGSSSPAVTNLPPGRYQVFALAGVGDFEYRNPQAVEKYLPHAAAVILQPHDHTTVSVDVQDSQEQPE